MLEALHVGGGVVVAGSFDGRFDVWEELLEEGLVEEVMRAALMGFRQVDEQVFDGYESCLEGFRGRSFWWGDSGAGTGRDKAVGFEASDTDPLSDWLVYGTCMYRYNL